MFTKFSQLCQKSIFNQFPHAYHASTNEYVLSLLSRLNNLPGLHEAKKNQFIVSSQLEKHSVELIESTLRQLFTNTHYRNTLTALESKKFSIPELLDAHPEIRSQYINMLENNHPSTYIPLESVIKTHKENEESIDNIISKFCRR